MTGRHLADDEVIVRRIPPGPEYIEPTGEFTSVNFKLRHGDFGLSVYRLSIVAAAEVLVKPEAIPNSRLAYCTVGEIRDLTNTQGDPLSLDVLATDDDVDPGHAEIRGPDAGRLSRSASKAIKRVFRWLEE